MPISNSIDRFNGVVASLAIKVRCVAGITVNVPGLTGISNPYDGFFLADGDRVLLTAQLDPILNGIWCVNATGDWSRAADWDGSRDVELGSTVWAGKTLSGSDALWQVTAPAGVIQPGNTAVTITLLLDPDSVGGISGTTVDSTVRYDGVSDYVENLNFLVEADGQVTLPNAIPIRWDDAAGVPVDLLEFLEISTIPIGGAAAVANFEGADGARTYTGDDGRVWTFGGSTAINDISNAQAKFGSTSYDFGGQGANDDHIFTDITTEYNAGNFVPGAKNWFIKFWVWNDSSQVGGHDYGCIGDTTGTRRAIRWSNNNNTVSMAYDSTGGGGENNFPTFGAAPTDGVWHEFVFERFGNGIYFYLDGVQQGSTFDCTGDNAIGSGLTAPVKALVIGSSVQNAIFGITPVPNSYTDAFEMVIGRSLNAGVAPGSPEGSPPAPLADTETMVVGNAAQRTELRGSSISFAGAYDMPLVDGVAGQILVTDGDGRVSFGSNQGYASMTEDLTTLNGNLLTVDPAPGNSPVGIMRFQNLGIGTGAGVRILDVGGIGSASTVWEIFRSTDQSGGFSWSLVDNHSLSSANHRLFFQNQALTKFLEFDNSGEIRIGGAESTEKMFVDMTNNRVAVRNGATLFLEEVGAAVADQGTHGQLWINNADQSLNYKFNGLGNLVLAGGSATVLPVFNGVADAFIDLNWDVGDFNPELNLGAAKTGGAAIIRTPNLVQFNLTALATGTWQFMAGPNNLSPHFAISHTGTFCTLGTSTVSGGDIVMQAQNGTRNIVISQGSCLALVEQAAPNADVLTRGQFWVDSADALPYFRDELGVDHALTGGGVSFPLDANDGQQIRFGTGQDITMDWDGVDFEIRGAASNQTINFRDGLHLVLWDSTDSDNIDIHHDGNDVNITSAATASITFVDVPVRLDDSVELQFGTGNDASIEYDGVSSLDMDLITDDTFYIQEAGTDRFGFNHLNNRLELLTGNRLLAYSSDNLEWMEYYHDGSDGHIGTGGTNPGSIILESAIVHIVPTDTVSANAVTLATEDSNGFFVDLEPATAAVVITLGGSPPSGYYVASIRVQQDGATAQTISFAGGVILDAGGTPHPVTTTLDGITIYTVETWDGGTTWHISGVDYS